MLVFAELARAGGPNYVAGVGYFNAGLAGHPITWSGGTLTYYTDQGDLSPLLRGTDADAFVADAFSRWTSISTAAVSANRGGQLSENVSGTNVTVNTDGSVTMPADILPNTTAIPIAIVYDYDGAITDALRGSGSSSDCFAASVLGGPDAFSLDGHFAHALVIINGMCAQTSAQLPDMKYHLVRALGAVFGLGWSQLNLNVSTGSPYPTGSDKAGFPVMHASDLKSCLPISACYPNADQPKLDDQAALSRLYPVTAQNIGQFSGKRIFSSTTARIRGSVLFTDASGNPAQPMQGVNVVARWIDPSSGQPSGQYAVSCVSGFAFSGNAGSPITGYNDLLGQPLNRFGSTDASLEGFFDLSGLIIASGNEGQIQLSVEALDTDQSQNVGPYSPWQVQPSGTVQPIVLNIELGDDVQQDILMQGAAQQNTASLQGSYYSPIPVPTSGVWTGTLSPYGDVDYFSLNAHDGRTVIIDVTTLDEQGRPTENKAQPAIGAWSIADPPGTLPPAVNSSPFNVTTFGMTQLNAQFSGSGQFRIGIADLRGDGRPDYSYRARVLYGDLAEPSRVSTLGNLPVEIDGIGFQAGTTVTVGSTNATLLSLSSTDLLIWVPPAADGTQSISISDPASGASVTLQDVLTYGAGPNDSIRLTQNGNSATPMGGETAYPIRVAVTSPDGSTAVGGATVQWSVNNTATLTACNGTSTCTVLTDYSGKVETRVDVGAIGTATITATLAPASYSPPKLVQTVISGNATASDLSLFSPRVWVAKGATVDVPLTARLLSSGAPVSGKSINFQVLLGTGSLNPATATTDANGYARSTLHLSSLSSDVQGSACLAPANNPCQSFYVMSVAAASLKLENVSGVAVGQAFQAVSVRVTDSSAPANPVLGAAVSLQQMMFLPSNEEAHENQGETSSSHNAMKVILGASQRTIVSNANGLVVFAPDNGNLYGPMEIQATVNAGTSAILQFDFQQLPLLSPNTGASTGKARAPVSVTRNVGTVPIRTAPIHTAPIPPKMTTDPPTPQRMRNAISFELDLGQCPDDDTSQSECESKTPTSSSTDPPSR